MQFNYEKKFENNDKWYTVGIVKGLIKDVELFAVEILDPAGKELCEPSEWKPGNVAIAVFGITEDEFNMFSENTEDFDLLVEKLKKDIPKDRLFAERNCVRKTDRKETIDKDNEFKKYISTKIQAQSAGFKVDVKEYVSKLLSTDKIWVSYSSVTDRPAVNLVNENANLILATDEKLMDDFLTTQKNVYKKVFLGDVINSDREESVFTYFYKIGINLIGFLLPDKKILTIPLASVLNSEEYKSVKPESLFSNPMLDRYTTCLLQLLRTTPVTDENKDIMNKNIKFLDAKIMEAALSAKYILSQKAKKAENNMIEVSLSVIEQKETKEKLIPVFTTEDEVYNINNGFDKVIVTYEQLKDLVLKNNLDGFVLNHKSKCSLKFTKQKFEQIEAFKKWRDEQIKKTES